MLNKAFNNNHDVWLKHSVIKAQAPIHGWTVCTTQALHKLFDLCSVVWLFVSCCVTLAVHYWFLYCVYLSSRCLETSKKEFWQNFVQLYKIKNEMHQNWTSVQLLHFFFLLYSLFFHVISKNNCHVGGFVHVFCMRLAKKLKFAQTYHIMYGDSYYSLVLQHPVVHHAVVQICLTA